METINLELLRTTLADIATSLSTDNTGLLYSTYPEDEESIEIANEIIQDDATNNSNCRLLLLREIVYSRLYLTPSYTEETDEQTIDVKHHNSLSGGVKSNFFQRLHQSNQGSGYADIHWKIIAFEADGTIQVHKDELTLWIKPKKHLIKPLITEQVGDYLTIRLPKNILDPGVYIAVGNAGRVSPGVILNQAIAQLHFNFEAINAPAIMSFWTSALNQLGIPFCFAIGHESCTYDRADPGILLFDQMNQHAILEVLTAFLQKHQTLLRAEVPILTKAIAPGVSYAEHPTGSSLSFHLYCCHLISQALLLAWEKKKEKEKQDDDRQYTLQPSEAIAAIESCFAQHDLRLGMSFEGIVT